MEKREKPGKSEKQKHVHRPIQQANDHRNPIDSIVQSLDEALEEDVREIDDVFEGLGSEAEESVGSGKKIHRVFIVTAVFMLIFSAIGIIASADFIKGFVADIIDRKALKNEFALFLYPVVINDPPTFDSTENLQSTTVITAAIWKIILTGNTDNYEKNMGIMRVPAPDVELSARTIFGQGFTIEHMTVDNIEFEFRYIEQENVYEIPESPRFLSYSPVILDLTNVGELYTVTVEYMEPSPLAIAGIKYENKPVKTLIYTISRSRDRMTINSISFAETGVVVPR